MRYQSWWLVTNDIDEGYSHVFDGEASLGQNAYITLCDLVVTSDGVHKDKQGQLCWTCFNRLHAGEPQQRIVRELAEQRRKHLAARPHRHTRRLRAAV